jgi:cysteine synthase
MQRISSNFKNLYIKDESKNTYGTYKDRRSLFIIKKALAARVSKLCLITSGNAGYSLAKLAKPKKIKVVCVVDKNLKKSIKTRLKSVSYRLVECDLSKKVLTEKDIIRLAKDVKREKIWDVTNGYPEAYEDIIKELKNKKFEYLICPVGSGEAFMGLYKGLKKYKVKAKLIGVGVATFPSIADKLSASWTPYRSKINKALKEGHALIQLQEHEIAKTYRMYRRKMKCEISSSVVWAALHKVNIPVNAKIVLLNSGKGLI